MVSFYFFPLKIKAADPRGHRQQQLRRGRSPALLHRLVLRHREVSDAPGAGHASAWGRPRNPSQFPGARQPKPVSFSGEACACTRLCVCICMYAFMCMHVCIYMCGPICACMHVPVCVCMYTCVYMFECVYMCACAHLCVCLCICMCVHLCVCVCM